MKFRKAVLTALNRVGVPSIVEDSEAWKQYKLQCHTANLELWEKLQEDKNKVLEQACILVSKKRLSDLKIEEVKASIQRWTKLSKKLKKATKEFDDFDTVLQLADDGLIEDMGSALFMCPEVKDMLAELHEILNDLLAVEAEIDEQLAEHKKLYERMMIVTIPLEVLVNQKMTASFEAGLTTICKVKQLEENKSGIFPDWCHTLHFFLVDEEPDLGETSGGSPDRLN